MTERGRRWGEAGYCPGCDREIPDGHDTCIGLIPGVSKACCGHGDPANAFVHLAFRSGAPAEGPHVILAGADAVAFFELARRGDWKNVSDDQRPLETATVEDELERVVPPRPKPKEKEKS